MKHLTTFIFGLILAAIGSICIIKHLDFISFWDYFWVILGCINVYFGYEKLNKSTY